MTVLVVQKLCAILFLVLGLSYVLNTDHWLKYAGTVLKNHVAMIPMALIMLITGLFIVLQHNVWIGDWPVIITVFGWMFMVGGMMFLVFPKTVALFADMGDSELKRYILIGGVVTSVLSVVLVYKFFF